MGVKARAPRLPNVRRRVTVKSRDELRSSGRVLRLAESEHLFLCAHYDVMTYPDAETRNYGPTVSGLSAIGSSHD